MSAQVVGERFDLRKFGHPTSVPTSAEPCPWQISEDERVGNRYIAPAMAVSALLTGLTVGTPAAAAEEPGPLYSLVDTAAQRLMTAEPVAAFKWINGGPINDPPRVQVVLDGVGADASAQQLDPQYVRDIFRDQINATEGIQFTRFGQWKLDPALAPATAPDLAASRTAIDGYNRTMVTEIGAHRDTLLGPACGAALDSAAQAVITARALDPMYQQALAVATESYC
jgi:chorismate mutase